jgi:hypothetical protein
MAKYRGVAYMMRKIEEHQIKKRTPQARGDNLSSKCSQKALKRKERSMLFLKDKGKIRKAEPMGISLRLGSSRVIKYPDGTSRGGTELDSFKACTMSCKAVGIDIYDVS